MAISFENRKISPCRPILRPNRASTGPRKRQRFLTAKSILKLGRALFLPKNRFLALVLPNLNRSG